MFYFPNEDIHKKNNFIPPYCTQIFRKRIFASHPTLHRYSQKEYFHHTLLYNVHRYSQKEYFHPTLLYNVHRYSQKEYFLPPYCTQIFTKKNIFSYPTVHRYSQKEYFHPTLLFIDIHKKNIFIPPYCREHLPMSMLSSRMGRRIWKRTKTILAMLGQGLSPNFSY